MRSLEEEQNDVKIGLEIHFQVSGRKLFCECKGEEGTKELESFTRRLTIVSGEKSEKDAAALQESMKGKEFEYRKTENSCLVEMDEEPPHHPGKDTLETAIIVSLILGCKVVDNVHFMRKIVIDGSNTSGFQRTGVIGLHGAFKTESKTIGVTSVTLEEEACRKIREDEKKVVYSLDRLGIPLIEISTDPDIRSPKEAREVAESIGLAVKQSRMIRREASSIRQDLNISIRGGNRVEIKGVQSLSQIERVLSKEIERQQSLLEIAEILSKRNMSTEFHLEDLTHSTFFKSSDIFIKGLKSGKKIFGFTLPGLSGVLNDGKYRLGREIADRLRAVGIGGFIHSDELPNYGIDEEEKQEISEKLGVIAGDAFGLVSLESNRITQCIEIIQNRILEAKKGVPAETRGASDNETRFLRPLPGSSRMYPETDIPLIPLDSAYIRDVERKVPPTVEQRVTHLESLGVPRQEAFVSLWKEYDVVLESFVNNFGNPKVCARFLAVVFASEQPDVEKASTLMGRFSRGNIPSESLEALYKDGEYSMPGGKKIVLKKDDHSNYVLELQDNEGNREIDSDFRFKNQSDERLLNIIENIIRENETLVKERGDGSFKLLMGEVMKQVRGEFEGKEISDLLKKMITEKMQNRGRA
ncbi:MAG: Glu-tRNA(Gln) amidotransferase subunit GatE [Thermoplasmata archaeon]